MYDLSEITAPNGRPGDRTFVISDPDTLLSFTVSSIHSLNNAAAWDDPPRLVPVVLLNGQMADALIEVVARLNRHRCLSTLP